MEKMLSERENPQTASDELLKGLKDEYEMRSQTPYYQKIKDSMAGNSLPRSEILVEISADPEDFEDHGVFYTAPGRISLPVTFRKTQSVIRTRALSSWLALPNRGQILE